MVPARSSCHGISCSRHLSRSQAEIPLILAVQFSRASSHKPAKICGNAVMRLNGIVTLTGLRLPA
ncbi:hypothetical protein ELI49_38115 [Rhizobium ruizarguesonis]|uniref:Uncharacterized protein n=1 Tax=Rhizobium ruizarguesonis TaxID=2081791 RepID=A0AAE8PQ35_9HYPH|nr:hypothetical protein ELI56_37600 [Rhizobium ruizarguesonis]TAT70282.1 hypothetical protein ELI52_37595 [Rhizobium ruizarguesonis]TAT81844.1 hypothetical protein ELI54_27125 [Rhizobium ruizarguesonis]TAT91570.1 hypothetical protein ELI55_37770 [Rhizobium ruizarguesonis]TAT93363.1 hypothetical protein ELI53_31030 [Rhizobium ruizarguesonis]